jgi:hypothetical protein
MLLADYHDMVKAVPSNRTDRPFHNSCSAMVIAARSDDPERPSREVAGRQCPHMRDPSHE